jgi:hypothetical protein
MNDKMEQGDGVAVQLACGHPNKNAGEHCELCGQTVAGVTKSPADEAGPAEIAGQAAH